MPAPRDPPPAAPVRFGAYGGTTSVFVDVADRTAWTATLAGGDGWLALTTGARGTGCGLVTLEAQRSTAAEHTAQLTVADAAGRPLLACAAIQFSAEPLATLNTSVLQIPFSTVPTVMELGIAGKFVAAQIDKIPKPYNLIALAAVEALIVLLGQLAIALRAALASTVPEPLTWFGAPGPYAALAQVQPATAVFLQEETDLLAIYVPIEVAAES